MGRHCSVQAGTISRNRQSACPATARSSRLASATGTGRPGRAMGIKEFKVIPVSGHSEESRGSMLLKMAGKKVLPMSRLFVPAMIRIWSGSPALSTSATRRTASSSTCSPATPRLITRIVGSSSGQSPHSTSESPSMSKVCTELISGPSRPAGPPRPWPPPQPCSRPETLLPDPGRQNRGGSPGRCQ